MGTVCLFIFSSFPGSLPMFCLVVGSAAGIREHKMEYVRRQDGVPPKGSYGKEGKGAEGGV